MNDIVRLYANHVNEDIYNAIENNNEKLVPINAKIVGLEYLNAELSEKEIKEDKTPTFGVNLTLDIGGKVDSVFSAYKGKFTNKNIFDEFKYLEKGMQIKAYARNMLVDAIEINKAA
jgi:hypothetical protein